jgi:ABC-type antimicrobial peptide transport system permease subunit
LNSPSPRDPTRYLSLTNPLDASSKPISGILSGKALSLPGAAARPSGEARANRVNVFGLAPDALSFIGADRYTLLSAKDVLLNHALAAQLGVKKGDEILLRVQKPSALSREVAVSPHGAEAVAMRLIVGGVLDANEGGDLDLTGSGSVPMNAFVDLRALAARLNLQDKINLVMAGPVMEVGGPPGWWSSLLLQVRVALGLSVGGRSSPAPSDEATVFLDSGIRFNHVEDIGLRADPVTAPRGMEIRSPRVFLDPALADRALKAAGEAAVPVLTYLANLITIGTNSTPYSMVTAAVPPYTPADLGEDEIIITDWLARDLHARAGDTVALSYFLPASGTELLEATNHFKVRAVVPLEGRYADKSLMPEFPGIEDADSPHDWNGGFPVVYKVRPQDEQYWRDHRGTPKAYISLAAGQRMWGSRFGNLTAIRIPNASGGMGAAFGEFSKRFFADLLPRDLGFGFEPVREQALRGAEQGQDFGQLFLGFSFFLVVAALLLMALLFQFGLEQRTPEIGTLLALGFTPRQVRRLFLGEGAALALLGGIFGTLGGLAYARAMLWGLTTVWREAVGGELLRFHCTAASLGIGLGASTLVAVVTLWFALRKQARQPARELLAEGSGIASVAELASQSVGEGERRRAQWLANRWSAGLAAAGGLGLVGWALASGERTNAEVFFGAGTLLLLAGLAWSAVWLRTLAARTDEAHFTLSALSIRFCARRRRRSLATVALLASGVFLIVSVGAFHLDANRDAWRPTSGTGGFALYGESTLPVVHDLNTQSGRDAFGLDSAQFAGVKVTPFRVRAGDEASCLNLNRAQRPRLLGVKPQALAGRFTFAGVASGLKSSGGWGLLQTTGRVDEVPAIGDANSIEWAMGKKLGDTLDYTDEQGRPFKVRLVGALANSILQGGLVIDEAAFVKRFPGESGTRLFLVDAPSNMVSQVSAALSRALQDVGLELTPAPRRLAAFNAVQNTYLGTFQVLGGLGLLLGSAGLGIVVLRNVLERRGELGLLTAVGFRRRRLHALVMGEHSALLGLGLGLGLVTAAVAVLPALLLPGSPLPYGTLAITLGGVVVNGAAWTWAATRMALRGNLLAALRNE